MQNKTSNSRIADYKMDSKDTPDPSNPKTADLSALKINRQREEKIKRRRWPKVIPWILIPAILVIGYFILMNQLKQGKTVDSTTVRLVKGASAKATLSASGYIVAQRSSAVASKATGRVVYLAVGEGDVVTKGQLIARIESEDVEAALLLSEANLKYSIADSIDAASQYNRNLKLREAGTITEEALETYETMLMRAIATVEARRASVKSAQISIDNTYITAPFDGTVITKIAEIGDIVAPFASSASSAGAVVVLADMSSLEVEADVAESNIQKVKVNQPCEISLDAYPEVRYTGHVQNIIPTANRASATIMTRIVFDKLDSLLIPEMSARVYFMDPENQDLSVEEPSYIGVSQNAIVSEDDNSYVFLIEDEIVEKRKIEIGKTIGKTVEVLDGLEPGDEVVLTPSSSIKDGDKVKISE